MPTDCRVVLQLQAECFRTRERHCDGRSQTVRLQAPIPQLTDAILRCQLVYQTAEAEASRHHHGCLCPRDRAQAIIKDIAKRTNHFVPPSLSHESSWATSSITSWLAINLASARLQSHPHRACLSSRYTIPSFFHPLLDGENLPSPDATNPPQSTANNSLSSKHPSRLIPPSLLNFHQSPSKAGCHYTRPMAVYSV